MVGRLTAGKQGFEEVDARMRELMAAAEVARAELLELADRDAHAFDGVMAAFKMPKDSDEQKAERSAAIQAGYADAARVPLETAEKSVALMELAREVTATGNPQAASDGLSAAASAYCAAICAIANVEINAASLKDDVTRVAMIDRTASLRAHADQLLREAATAFQLRLG